MFYVMVKCYDEWLGEVYEGFSCCGVIKGWYNSGVCNELLIEDIKYSNEFEMILVIVNNVSNYRLGVYYCIEWEISDFYVVFNEVGVIFVFVRIYEGWKDSEGDVISLRFEFMGGYVFVIVGYNDEGFWI